MRKHALILLLITITCCCFAQQAPEKVRITKWGRKVYAFTAGYWDRVPSEGIIKAIGEEEYEKVKKFGLKPALPKGMGLVDGKARRDTATLYQRLNNLHMYRIATFISISNSGKEFEMAILRVPYAENRDWDSNVSWDTLYFFIENKYVEPSK